MLCYIRPLWAKLDRMKAAAGTEVDFDLHPSEHLHILRLRLIAVVTLVVTLPTRVLVGV